MFIYYRSDKVSADILLTEQTDIVQFLEKLQKNPAPDARVGFVPSTKLEAIGLLRLFRNLLAAGETIPPMLNAWIISSLSNTLDTGDPAKRVAQCFGLTRVKRGRPENFSHQQDMHNRMQQLIDSGDTVLDAKHKCAIEFGIHEANIEKAYYRVRAIQEEEPF